MRRNFASDVRAIGVSKSLDPFLRWLTPQLGGPTKNPTFPEPLSQIESSARLPRLEPAEMQLDDRIARDLFGERLEGRDGV
jgi:hypothetical protein